MYCILSSQRKASALGGQYEFEAVLWGKYIFCEHVLLLLISFDDIYFFTQFIYF